ncbi:PDDEXK-like family protein [Roseicyclus marinus]|uniref:hypothetical protein n=1 Tax=Roseicyclus marinus TaxID=2161673 RepID=UPI00240EC46A|nr:hypothetical protein [Roseicyclus marinus]MDG3042476.1 hypothetical protein [Roseicyclus marinus]
MPKRPFNTLISGDDCTLSRASEDLRDYPNVSPDALSRHARAIGAAGEALVDSLLLRHGLTPATVQDGLATDRLLQLPGGVVRLQIKTRTSPGPTGYTFRMAKGYRGNPCGRRPYSTTDYDIAALVMLPLNLVYFTAEKAPQHLVRFSEIRRLHTSPLASLDVALRHFLDLEEIEPPLPGF